MFSFVVLPVNPRKGNRSWRAEETTNGLFRPKLSPTDCSPIENLVHLESDDQISSLITWLSLVSKNLKTIRGVTLAQTNDDDSEASSYVNHMMHTWCEDSNS